jgi:hypothetical protein
MISWPVTLNGFLSPARGKLDQYEFWCRDRAAIAAALPLVTGNPYVETVSTIKGMRQRGIQITCKYADHTVRAQFHRKTGSKGIWIGSNFTNEHDIALRAWRNFVAHFGVTVGMAHPAIPIQLEFHVQSTFHPSLLVVVR